MNNENNEIEKTQRGNYACSASMALIDGCCWSSAWGASLPASMDSELSLWTGLVGLVGELERPLAGEEACGMLVAITMNTRATTAATKVTHFSGLGIAVPTVSWGVIPAFDMA
jgi:hypothetical protein